MCAIAARLQGDYARARVLSEASVALWRTVGDEIGLAHSLVSFGLDHVVAGEFERADVILTEGLALARRGDDAFTLSTVLMASGISFRAQGQHERAAVLFREAAAVAEDIERANYRTLAVIRARLQLGYAESQQGASSQALPLLQECLAAMRDSGMAGNLLGTCLDWLAVEVGRSGQLERAALLFGAADAQMRRAGSRRLPFDAASIERAVDAVRAGLGEDAFSQAVDEGCGMDMAQVFACALDNPHLISQLADGTVEQPLAT